MMTRDSVRSLFSKQRDEIVKALPQHLDADTFIRVFLTAINKTPKLLECSQASLMQAAMDLAQLGLVADSVMGLAYLIPFNDRQRGMICQLIVGYQGYIELAYRSPKVKAIRWNVVHAKDRFDYVDGFEPRLVHTPCDDEDPGPLVNAYAICKLDGGEMTYAVLNRRDIMKAKSASKSANSDYSPWTTWEEPMWAKTCVKAMLKRVPKSRELEQAYAKDADDGVIDVQATTANATPVVMELPEETKDESPKETTQPNPAPAAGPAAQEAPVAEPPAAASAKTKKPAKAEAVKVEEKTKVSDLFEEKAEHLKLRALAEQDGVTEAQLLEHLRTSGLIDESASELKMIPGVRAGIIIRSWDTIVKEIKG